MYQLKNIHLHFLVQILMPSCTPVFAVAPPQTGPQGYGISCTTAKSFIKQETIPQGCEIYQDIKMLQSYYNC
jgi:hypothetical protein